MVIYLGITFKNHLMVFGSDTGSVISNLHKKVVLLGPQFYLNSILPMIKSIFNKVSDDLAKFQFVLKHLEGLSYAQIGEVLGLPVDTVETRLVRARRLLREALRDDS